MSQDEMTNRRALVRPPAATRKQNKTARMRRTRKMRMRMRMKRVRAMMTEMRRRKRLRKTKRGLAA
jgi:hypothetical protein